MEKLYKLISDTQASLFLLFQKTWVYHWHIVGPDFKQIHDLFGEQYVSIQEEVDRISEHMRFLGIKPISSLSSLNVSANTALTYLNCSDNSLTSLDVLFYYIDKYRFP